MQGVAVGVVNGKKELEDKITNQAIMLRTDLINQILSEAPEDKKIIVTNGWVDGQEVNYMFNQANQLWRELLQSKLN